MFTAIVLLSILVTGGGARGPDPGARQRAGHASPETPTVFAPGVISTDAEEYRITFTPDGRTAYFARGEKFFPASRRATIMVSHLRAGRWSAPRVAPFSGTYSDIDPFISPDGSELYFSSIRPAGDAPRKDLDLWVVKRTKGGWGEPQRLGGAVNSEADELYPSVAADGTLYFASERAGGAGGWDIYRSKPSRSGAYAQVENLGAGVNTPGWEFNPAVSPDGKVLVFTSLNRPGGEGLGDLYLSRSGPGGWSPARNLGAVVNTKADEYHPSFSPDGRHLFFVRRSAGERVHAGDIYRVGWTVLRTSIPDERPGAAGFAEVNGTRLYYETKGTGPAVVLDFLATIAREYYTEYGLLTFAAEGERVTGTYPHEGGQIAGTLRGHELQGTWRQRDGAGSIVITFSPDFGTFKARYNHTETPEKWATDWTGMRKPPLQTREYQTTWGVLSCSFEGSQVSCTYPWYNGKVMGELKGRAFRGLWLQSNGGVGTLNITFADDFSRFDGNYNDFNHHPEKWAEWSGTLKR